MTGASEPPAVDDPSRLPSRRPAPTHASWLNWIGAEFTALRSVTLDGSDVALHELGRRRRCLRPAPVVVLAEKASPRVLSPTKSEIWS